MPRGRPPIPRSKEEAFNVRREQVRKNVQAYRKRKQTCFSPGGSAENNDHIKEKAHTFVIEDIGQWNKRTQVQTIHPAIQIPEQQSDPTSYQHVTIQNNCLKETDRIESPVGNDSTQNTDVILLPPEINAAQVSRQQLTSNAALAFSPTAFVTESSKGPHWSQMIPNLVNRNPILDFCIQAICIMQISHANQEHWLLHRSLDFYDRALKSLQVALARPAKQGFQPEIFAATMGLATYELLHGTNAHGRGWMYHIEGAITYLNMFPELNVCTFSHQMSFHFLETICIFDALGSRRPSCFSGSKWWRNSVDRFAGEPYGSLLRMMTSLPRVLQRCDEALLLPPTEDAYAEWSRLLKLTMRLENAFTNWFDKILNVEMPYHDSCIPYPMAVDEIDQLSEIFSSVETDSNISFPNLHAARLYLLYWSSLILLYDSTFKILAKTMSYGRLSPIDEVNFSSTYTATSHTLGTSILRSVPYCTRSMHAVDGKSLVLLPLHIARIHFRDNGYQAEAHECSAWLERLGQKEMTFGLKVKKGL